MANTLPKGGMSFHDWRLVHGSGKLTTSQPSNVRARASCGHQTAERLTEARTLGTPIYPARGFGSAEESRFEAFTSNQKHVFGPQNRTSPPHRAAALRFTCARRTLWRWAGLIMSSRGRTIATGLTLMGLRRLGAGEQSCSNVLLTFVL